MESPESIEATNAAMIDAASSTTEAPTEVQHDEVTEVNQDADPIAVCPKHGKGVRVLMLIVDGQDVAVCDVCVDEWVAPNVQRVNFEIPKTK